MSTDILSAWFAAFIVIAGFFFCGYMIADAVQFTRAIWTAYRQDRLKEWFAIEDRRSIGSGFRLYRRFRRSAQSAQQEDRG